MSQELEFVFSFRSPCAWIAMQRVLPLVHPEAHIRWTAFLPRPSFRDFGAVVSGKLRHILQDILRLSEAYPLPRGRPPIDDSDWQLAHATFLWADRAGHGPAFARALFDERWVRSPLVSTDAAIGRVAAVAAANDAELRAEFTALVETNDEERSVFGVPMFILPSGEQFGGHDRMEWAIRRANVRAAAWTRRCRQRASRRSKLASRALGPASPGAG